MKVQGSVKSQSRQRAKPEQRDIQAKKLFNGYMTKHYPGMLSKASILKIVGKIPILRSIFKNTIAELKHEFYNATREALSNVFRGEQLDGVNTDFINSYIDNVPAISERKASLKTISAKNISSIRERILSLNKEAGKFYEILEPEIDEAAKKLYKGAPIDKLKKYAKVLLYSKSIEEVREFIKEGIANINAGKPLNLQEIPSDTLALSAVGDNPHLTKEQKSDLKVFIDSISANEKLDSAYKDSLFDHISVLTQENWKPERIMGIINARVYIKEDSDIIDMFPKKMSFQTTRSKISGKIKDENGKNFDSMRGDESITAELAYTMECLGGDFRIYRDYAKSQAGDSWSSKSQALKYYFSMHCKTSSSAGACYFRDESFVVESHFREFCEEYDVAKIEATVDVLLAFNMEMLSSIDLPGVDLKSRTIALIRTENKTVLNNNQITVKDDGQQHTMKRGALESASIGASVTVFGTEVTVQHVPFHRVMGTYFLAAATDGRDRDFTCFKSDDEKEFTFMPEDIPFEYVSSYG